MADDTFTPALLVVDLQEDFCPPDGALAVPGGREVIGPVNRLLAAPGFRLRVATRDWHPADHVSFAASHPGSGKRAFEDTVTVASPLDPADTVESRPWPVHCVQGSAGAELASGLVLDPPGGPGGDGDEYDGVRVVDKGQDPRFEMYSPFYAPFRPAAAANVDGGGDRPPRVGDSGLAGLLRARGVTHVYVAGLAADYCVRAAAVDAAREGFRALLVEEATRPVDPDGWPACRRGIQEAGVQVVSMDGPEVGRVLAG